MRRDETQETGDEPLEDKTLTLPLHSKRTERLRRRKEKKQVINSDPRTLLDLPYELFIVVLSQLRPSDIFGLLHASKALKEFILQEETVVAGNIIKNRYAALAKCFPLPVRLEAVDAIVHPALLSDERQGNLNIHKRPYQHVKPPDPHRICTCLTCMLRWNALCLVIDFAHWQGNLDQGEPIPIIARGQSPGWNQDLISANSVVIEKALHSPLWHARILEEHLRSTVRSIRRHERNKGNKRQRFQMSVEDAASETDLFLERNGPPQLDFPFHRDNYYMLEAYLPNRGWNSEKQMWMYVSLTQHDRDIEFIMNRENRKKAAA